MSIDDRTHVRAYRHPWCDAVDLQVRQIRDGKMSVGINVTMKEVNEGEFLQETMRLSFAHAQQLMDDLWQTGLRPSEGTGSAGQLAATQKHLEDMRRLVFEKKP